MHSETKLAVGNRVRMRLAGSSDEWCYGVVALAGGSSVAILFNGMVRTIDGGYAGGVLPITVDYEAQTVVTLWGDEYDIEVAEEDQWKH